ncbi:MAG: DUF1501 domain-containing protein, partial [Planctomycetaceae bacterium]|nr:DUF1501 domain-containing protein [Planctomycetaceae bacterium]
MSESLISRRSLISRAGMGAGLLGLATLLNEEGLLAADLGNRALHPLDSVQPHFDARAKRVIWIFVNGGPSQVDTWDYKPALTKWDGKSIKEFDAEFKDTTGFFKNAVGGLMQSPF